jgi:hypothetical protein
MSKRVIYADVETAGVAQAEIEKAGLAGEIEVQAHPWVPLGMIIDGERATPVELIRSCYAGWSVLKPPT